MDGLNAENRGGVVVVRFTRPEIRNPLSIAILECLDEIVSGLSGQPLIITGSDGVFASGADLKEISTVNVREAPAFASRGQRLMGKIDSLPQLTIAAVNGFCFGGALDLALSCKRRIAVAGAKFAHPGSSLGIITGWGGTQRLPRLVGCANALEMFFTASPFDAERALSIGLIDEIADDPLETALSFVGAA
jgi:enoyl-CoA hydratase